MELAGWSRQNPGMEQSSSDLMAIAIVRRLLLETGIGHNPDDLACFDGAASRLQVWLLAPHAALGGECPLRVLQDRDGTERLRAVLAAQGLAMTPPPPLDATNLTPEPPA